MPTDPHERLAWRVCKLSVHLEGLARDIEEFGEETVRAALFREGIPTVHSSAFGRIALMLPRAPG